MKEIILNGDVGWEITARGLSESLPSGSEKVLLKVNSPGGSVFEGFDIYNVIKDYKGKVDVVINGLAASAASYFIMAADKITIRENSVFMAHKAWNLAIGDADDMKKSAEILDGIDGILAAAYSKRTGKEEADILEGMKNEIWLFGDEIMNEGFAEEKTDFGEEKADDIDMLTPVQARGKVAAVRARLEKVSNEMEQAKKAAAWIKDFASSSIPVEEVENKINKTEDSKMELNEFLNKNPEAKAEIESVQNDAKASEKQRVSDLLALAGVQMSDTLKTAIENGMSEGDFAKAELIAQNKKRAESKTEDFGKLEAKTKISDKVETAEPEIKALSEEDIRAMAKKIK